LRGLTAVVAAPIRDQRGEVIGALYGERRQGDAKRAGITELEAVYVEFLACGVAAGLAREEQEKKALTARVQFEQFFTPELARHLEQRPDLLNGQDTEVTVLFCDIRGFSRVSEKVGPARTVEWVRAVLGTVSECVLAQEGVVVDYIGDAAMAMWGAPTPQPDHATRAVRAALAMLARLPELNQRWQHVLNEPLCLGIGINTGQARVGNIGTDQKFKYGPLGPEVNLASRVQGLTKYLDVPLLITGSTKEALANGFDTRRLCRARVVNIAETVELYEVARPGATYWPGLQERYEDALARFEKEDCRPAARILANLLAEFPEDGPALVLLHRAVRRLVEKCDPFDPVWEAPGK
jgi:adenylate cyclase